MRWFTWSAFVLIAFATSSSADELQKTAGTPSAVVALPNGAVRLMPVPELSLLVPRGWVACDPIVNQQLGGTDLPAQTKETLCDLAQPPGTLAKLINPNMADFVVAMFSEAPAGAREQLDSLGTEDGLQRAKHSFCSGLSGAGACQLRLAVLGGHRAAIGKFEMAPQTAASGEFAIVVMSKHSYVVLFVERGTPHERANSVVDAMINSIETE